VGAAGATSFAAVLDSATNRAASRPAIPQAAETGGSTDVRRLEDAAREMEGVFLNFLWKQAWNMSGSSFFPSGLAGDVYKDFLTQAFSDRMAEAGGIGLANFIRLSVGQSAQTEPRP
jgi:Rod binding domain-containing protein